MEERVQKILARKGIASRRKAEELIAEGRVTVNGVTAVLGTKADQGRDHIRLDGKPIGRAEPKVYYLFNKPRGVMTTLTDPEGRPTVRDYLKGIRFRVFPVGRLDYDSEGLLLITNDGDFAQAVLHPSMGVPKTYLVKVRGLVREKATERLRRGILLEDGLTAPASVRFVRQTENNSWLEVSITEGRKRQIRRMMEAVGHQVMRLRRTAVDGVRLGNLRPGQVRPLTDAEVARLQRECGVHDSGI